jgi:hypothetical protein
VKTHKAVRRGDELGWFAQGFGTLEPCRGNIGSPPEQYAASGAKDKVYVCGWTSFWNVVFCVSDVWGAR